MSTEIRTPWADELERQVRAAITGIPWTAGSFPSRVKRFDVDLGFDPEWFTVEGWPDMPGNVFRWVLRCVNRDRFCGIEPGTLVLFNYDMRGSFFSPDYGFRAHFCLGEEPWNPIAYDDPYYPPADFGRLLAVRGA